MEHKKSKFVAGIDTAAMAHYVFEQSQGVTPIFAVSCETKAGEKKHFANFYGTTFMQERCNETEARNQVRENDAEIFDMIRALEQKIKAGNFAKVKNDLVVEVNWARLGTAARKEMSKRDDAQCCESVARAFALFQTCYQNLGKTEQQILDERFKSFQESMEALDPWKDFGLGNDTEMSR